MFNDYEKGPDFDRARTQIATPFEYLDVPLDTAADNQVINISGDFIYLDASSTGSATLEFNNQYNDPAAPFQIAAGWAANVLFKQVKLTWAAQAGKKLRIMWSTGGKIVPTNSAVVSGTVGISGVVSVSSLADFGASFAQNSALAANTAVQVFSAASNVSGAVVHRAHMVSATSSAMPNFSLLAKATTPATIVDGDVIMSTDNVGYSAGTYIGGARLESPVKIPAGKGLFFISTAAEVAVGVRSVLYTLL